MKHALLPALLLLAACGDTEGSTAGGGGSTSSSGAGGSSACPDDLPESCPSSAPGWAKDIAPVIEARCSSCHVAGGVAADKPFTSHDQVFSRKGSVLNQVYACKMPPRARRRFPRQSGLPSKRGWSAARRTTELVKRSDRGARRRRRGDDQSTRAAALSLERATTTLSF